MADQQTAGRGRGRNCWWSGPGSLAFSLLLEARQAGAGVRPSPLVGLAAAMAVVETVVPLVLTCPVGIHWPNDVFAAGRKLAGVLVEVLPDRRHIVGIGVNVNNRQADAPPPLQHRVATLRDLTGREHEPASILIPLLRHLEAAFRRLAIAPAELAARANDLCLQRGRGLTLHVGGRTIVGRCAGIAADGALLLDTPFAREAFYSGVLST